MSGQPGLLVVLTAPSGAGKSSVVRALLKLEPDLSFSVSHTTRSARPGEREGVDYSFVSREEFEAIRGRGGFVESAEVHGNLYGTSHEAIDGALASGSEILLDIDVQGARQVAAKFPQAQTIFLLPPDYATLERRLRGRGSETEASIQRRLSAAGDEVRQYLAFRYLVVNESIPVAAAEVRSILIASRANTERRRALAETIVSTFPGQPR